MKLTQGNFIQHSSIGIVEFVAKIGGDIYYKVLKSTEIYDGRISEENFYPIELSGNLQT